ncbi:Ger(x)C family spore germination protein [Rossellomorea yichunensis]|uniref:Ger(x)C family spore germination protein n=1 Tax=Rossellomorea yichunensis TaxID=3077331 RepID=UPI0028DFC688|nr:Ger(x)C family spore germination protein [Rossellomorea sp. YC4-1]MDT9025738.1 Ger(x)C family spore germination protein [Rossellomorea sp. YC4-1]
MDLLLGVGIDEGHSSSYEYSEEDVMNVTFQLVNVSGNQSPKTYSGNAKPFVNVNETGESLLEAAREVLLKRKNTLNGQHQRLVVLSSKVAQKRNIRELLDFFIRDPEARMSCLIMVTGGLSRDIMDTETDEIPSVHIKEVSDHIEKSNKLIEPMTLSKINATMEAKSSFLLQNIEKRNNEIILTGAAVINGDTLTQVGFLNEEELVGINWLTALTDGGIVKIKEEGRNKTITYELETVDSKVKPLLKNGQISFQVDTKVSGHITELLAETDELTKKENIKDLERQIEEKINEQIKNSLEKIQQDLKVDVLEFHDYVRIQHPDYWKSHKDDWDNTFSQANIDYQVDVQISSLNMNINE